MQVIKSNRIVYFDVDDTLILWDWKELGIEDVAGLVAVVDENSGVAEYGLPHHRHIHLMRQFKARGHTVVVWSQGGWNWAERAVKALGIENLVDVIIDKPNWYVDDLHANAYMERPVYLDPMNPLKDKRAWRIDDED